MTEHESENLTALLFARPEISTQMMSVMHMASGRKVVLATFLPIFNLANATTMTRGSRSKRAIALAIQRIC